MLYVDNRIICFTVNIFLIYNSFIDLSYEHIFIYIHKCKNKKQILIVTNLNCYY